MGTQDKTKYLFRSILGGIGMTVVYLLAGLVLDYAVTQLLSQFVIADCSEDCYFRYFNLIFIFVVVFSVIGGIYSGYRIYKRLSEN